MKKLVLLLLVVLLIAGGGFWYWRGKKAEAEPVVQRVTAEVGRGNIRRTVACTGRVVSNLDVEIKCKASGVVVALPSDVSDEVKTGDLLVEIDPVDQERAVQQQEASLAASEARLAQAKASLAVAEADLDAERIRVAAQRASAAARVKDASAKAKRERELLERQQSSIEEAETATTTAVQAEQELRSADAGVASIRTLELQLEVRRQEIALAQADVDASNIALKLAQQRLRETKVTATMDGVVSARNVQIGQIIASGVNNVGGGTTVMTVSDLSRMFVLASVDESDIGVIALDQPVEITADAHRGKSFAGKVVRIATTGVNTSNVVTFEVRIEVLDENKRLLKPEMTTNVEIVAAERSDVLSVPTRAVRRKEGKTYVTRVEGGNDQEVEVKTGLYGLEEVEILEGLAEKDVVLVPESEEESRWRNASSMRRPPTLFGGGSRGSR